MGISYAAYRYAPEQFCQLHVYRKPFPVNDEQRCKLGYIFATKGHDACVAEIKRLYRASLRRRTRCTIGFMLKDSHREYCFTRDLSAYDDSLSDKLRVLKVLKQFMLDCDCKYLSYKITMLDAGFQVESVEQKYNLADISRPVKIYFRPKEARPWYAASRG